MSAKVSPQILLRLRPRSVWADEARGWSGILSPSLFRGFAAKTRVTLGMDGGRGCCSFLSLCFFAPLARNTQHYGEGWGRCCWRLQPSDSYFGFRDGTLLVCLVGLPCLAGFGAQAVAVDQVADGRPGNLAVDPKLQLNQIALGGAGEGGKLLVGFDLGVEVAAVG